MSAEEEKNINRFTYVLDDKGNVFSPSLPRFLQIYSDKTATSLKSTAVVGYPLHLTLLSFESSFRRSLIKSNETVAGYLSEEYVSEHMDTHDEGGGTKKKSLD